MAVKPITSFKGQYAFLSNFYMRDLRFDGTLFHSAEHAYQAWKARSNGTSYFEQVRNAPTPAAAKRIAQSLSYPSYWEEIKVDLMKNVLRAKFSQKFNGRPNPLLTWLLNTGNAELVEGNTWGDVFWGQCPVGVGRNMLGKLLMLVRSESEHLRGG